MDRLGLEEDDEQCGCACECGLEPEDIAPRGEGDDYAAHEGAWVGQYEGEVMVGSD